MNDVQTILGPRRRNNGLRRRKKILTLDFFIRLKTPCFRLSFYNKSSATTAIFNEINFDPQNFNNDQIVILTTAVTVGFLGFTQTEN